MMGTAKSPSASWQWNYRSNPDRPWPSSESAPRVSSVDATDSLVNALECLNIDGSNMGRARAVTSSIVASAGSSLASNSRAQSFDGRAPRSISEDALRGSLMALTPRNLSMIQPSSMAELDHSHSPVSLRPHPGPPQSQFHRGVDLPTTLPLGAMNVGNQYVHSHPNSSRQLPVGVHHSGSINLPAYHSDSSLQVPSLHYGYPQVGSSSPLLNDFVGQLSVPTSLEAPASARKRGSGKPKIKNELYKTEICRSYLMNNGYCKYGAKCQFAHGDRERRPVRRHPRYKTKLCRNYVTTGECPYGSRCRFIHAPEVVQDENNTIPNYMLPSSHESRFLQYVDGNSATPNLISSSESTESPDASSRQFRDLYGTPVKDVDNLLQYHHELYPNSLNAVSVPSSADAGSGTAGRSPIRAFNLSGQVETGIGSSSDGHNASPSGAAQSRSRLPVFQTLSGGEGGSSSVERHH